MKLSYRNGPASRRAFTLMELLMAVAITAILASLSISAFVSFSRKEALEANTQALAMGLRDARAETLASVGGRQYGIAVSPEKFTLFQGASYDPEAVTNEIFEFSGRVRASSTISTIVFQRLTGNSTASGTIDIYLTSDPAVKRTVGIGSTGLVVVE